MRVIMVDLEARRRLLGDHHAFVGNDGRKRLSGELIGDARDEVLDNSVVILTRSAKVRAAVVGPAVSLGAAHARLQRQFIENIVFTMRESSVILHILLAVGRIPDRTCERSECEGSTLRPRERVPLPDAVTGEIETA